MVGTRGPRVTGKLGRQSAQKQRAVMATLAVRKPSSKKPAPKQEKKAQAPKKPAPAKKAPAPKAVSLPAKVRVWWPPTTVKRKTDLSGMYWPAKVEGKVGSFYNVKYDNGECEKVAIDKCSPYEQVVKHGKEKTPLQVGEFCEVLNGSKSDPAEWLARVVEREGKNYTVSYPFHDTPDDVQPESRVRRARVFDEQKKEWMCLHPKQAFKDGQVEAPNDLKLCSEATLSSYEPSVKAASKEKQAQDEGKKKKSAASGGGGGGAASGGSDKKKAEKAPAEKAAKKQKTEPKEPSEKRGGKAKQQAASMMTYVVDGRAVMVPSTLPAPPAEVEGKKKRKHKDPSAPKRPMNAYLIFLDRHRPLVKAKHPGYSISQVTTECAKLWKEVSAEERMVCNERAAEERARYDREMKDYTPPPPAESPDGDEQAADGGKKKRKKKDKDAPRKARTAFILFSMDFRERNKKKLEEAGFDGAAKCIGEAWGKLKDTERKRWVDKADEEAVQYKAEMFAYKEAKAEREAKAQDDRRLAYAQEQARKELAAEKEQKRTAREARKAAKQQQQSGGVPTTPAAMSLGALGGAMPSLASPVPGIDTATLREGVYSVAAEEAYYELVDAMHGEEKDRVERAACYATMGDWKAFLVAALGLERVKPYLR